MDLTKPAEHWPPIQFSKTLMMDALLKHLLGLAPYGMTDVDEVLEIAVQVRPSDEKGWLSSWGALANRLQDRAESRSRPASPHTRVGS